MIILIAIILWLALSKVEKFLILKGIDMDKLEESIYE